MVDLYSCTECGIEKNYSEFYSHPLTKEGIMHRCKECVKKGRRSIRERGMARKTDRKRYQTSPSRRKYVYANANIRRTIKGYGKIHLKTNRMIQKYGRPNQCSVCKGYIDMENIYRIVFHHPDYTKPFIGIFCCEMCHSKIHLGKINADKFIVNIQSPF